MKKRKFSLEVIQLDEELDDSLMSKVIGGTDNPGGGCCHGGQLFCECVSEGSKVAPPIPPPTCPWLQ